jgi:hypothetical protein
VFTVGVYWWFVRAPSGSTPSDAMGKKSKAISTTSKWDAASSKTDEVQWAAFFGDCAHEVMPVTSGHRITMTFAIVRGVEPKFKETPYGSDPVVASAPSVSTKHIQAMLAHIAARPKAVNTFGILLAHKYTFTGVETNALKGIDGMLLDSLQAAGYTVSVRPVIYRAHSIGQHWDNGDPGSASNVVYAFGADELEKICKGEQAIAAHPPITFVRCHDGPGAILYDNYEPDIEYTGNEALASRHDTIYFSAALIVSNPTDPTSAASTNL